MVIRMSTLAEPRPADCAIEFLNAPPAVGMLFLQQLAMIHVTYRPDEEQAVFAEVKRRACQVGGDVVSLNTSMQHGDHTVTQFLVFKKPIEEKKAPAPAGTQL